MNVFLLGLAFMFVFTGFNTMSGIQVGQAKRVRKKIMLMMVRRIPTCEKMIVILISCIQTLIFNSATKEHSGGFVPGFQVRIFHLS